MDNILCNPDICLQCKYRKIQIGYTTTDYYCQKAYCYVYRFKLGWEIGISCLHEVPQDCPYILEHSITQDDKL